MTAADDLAHAAKLDRVSRETLARFEDYVRLLEKWNKSINLISNSTSYDIWSRHIIDSAQLWPLRPRDARSWVDLGSGGGLPGIPLAILAREFDPDATFTLMESDQRKCAFLTTAIQNLALNARVVTARIEEHPPENADVVTARALAPLTPLLDHCARHVAPTGTILLLKGRSTDAELTEARKFWTFDLTRMPSVTDPEAVLLRIGALARV